jgi:aerobic carbon-monoxide dehydrogenase small subunit
VNGKLSISMTVNGRAVEAVVEPRTSFGDFLRNDLGLTGTHIGCEMCVCGACLVLLDGRAVHSCLMYGVQADGHKVETVEGLTERGAIADIRKAFHERNALHCGFCTPGILVTAYELLNGRARPSRADIRDALSGNYRHCTGYEAIVDTFDRAARERQSRSEPPEGATAATCRGWQPTTEGSQRSPNTHRLCSWLPPVRRFAPWPGTASTGD